MLNKKILIILLLTASANIFAGCEVPNNNQPIINEISKFHGADWKNVIQTGICSSSQVREHLKNIISNHNNYLATYPVENRGVLYRNAVKEFGSFSDTNSYGEISNEDQEFLSDSYLNSRKLIGEEMFKDPYLNQDMVHASFQTNYLESIKNTGSLSALDIYADLLEQGDAISDFQLNNIAQFIENIIEGQEENLKRTGDQREGSDYFPNLDQHISKRYKNFDYSSFKEKLIRLKKSLDKYIKNNPTNINHYQKAISYINKSVSYYAGLKPKIKRQSRKTKKNGKLKREPQSINEQEENSNRQSFHFLYLLYALLLVGLIIFILSRFTSKK